MTKKNIALCISLCLVALLSYAQTSPYKLAPIVQIIKRESVQNRITALSIRTGLSESHHVKTAGSLIDLFNIDNAKSTTPEIKANVTLFKRNANILKSYFDDVTSFGDNSPELYYSIPKEGEPFTEMPFGFAIFNNVMVFYQSGLFYNKSLNTIKLGGDERAKLVTKEVILPSLSNFEPLLSSTDIKYFSIIVGYTAKDFSSDSVADEDGETTAIVIAKSILKKYLNAELTDEEVFAQATFYNVNKNAGITVKKIIFK